jgi:iron complex outermembrane receptor protein
MNEQTIDDLQYGAQIDLTKKWGGAVHQRSLLTFDIFEDETKQKTWQLSGTPLDNELRALGLATTTDLNAWKKPDPFTPEISGRLPTPDFKPALWPMTDGSTFNLFRYYYGGLFNHTVELLNERLMLTGSLRQDWAEFERQQLLSADPELRRASGKTDKLTYSVGANYHFVPRQLVGYVSYGTSFDPAPQTDPNTGEIMGNKTAAGAEVGLKGALLQEAFSYTLSAYKVEQENEVTDNPANPGGIDPLLARFVPGGSSKGRGLSLDLSGRLTEGLTLLGNIAWTDIWISKNLANPALVGTRPTANLGMPGRTGALAARYNFKSGALKGLSLGLNYQYYQKYVRILGTATSSDFVLPSRSEWGAMANYNVRFGKKLSTIFSVNVTNLFDERKLTVAAFTPPGREIRFTTSLKY